MRPNRLAWYAWSVLAFNILVILWGAFVRATGSGAGCGSHWPLCNGEVLLRAPQAETLVEFSHRLTSGLAFILVVLLSIMVFRGYPKGSQVRLGAGLSMLFIITEALVGAGLVLFEWVAMDVSLGRVVSMSVHLINTFLLLAALVMTAWWVSGGERIRLDGYGVILGLFGFSFVVMLLLGVSGAITALGDTVFKAESLAEGIRQDFDTTAHFLIRLRIWHPALAVLVGLYVLFLSGLVAMFRVTPRIRRLCAILAGFYLVQLVMGLINLLLLAPVWMQIVHLFLEDLVWILLVLLTLANFAESEVRHSIAISQKGAPANPV